MNQRFKKYLYEKGPKMTTKNLQSVDPVDVLVEVTCTRNAMFESSMFLLSFDWTAPMLKKEVDRIGAKRFKTLTSCRHCFSASDMDRLRKLISEFNNSEEMRIQAMIDNLHKEFPNKVFSCKDR